VVISFPTLGDNVFHFGQTLLVFRNGDAKERLAQHPLIGGEDFDLVVLRFEALTVAGVVLP
jgi:hypothetical protein